MKDKLKISRRIWVTNTATATTAMTIIPSIAMFCRMASSYAVNTFKQASARLKATKAGLDFMFIMSKKDKDVVLLRVSKSTRDVEGEINLGKDREPIYALDDITGQVYYRSTDKELTSYQTR